jgi:dTDP-4-dehydrorhamnose 3,5-epimerase
MQFQETPIAGVYLIELEPRHDDRGYLARCWCEDEFDRQGLTARMVQANVIVTKKRGTLRGIHFQLPPYQEAKLVRCLRGEIYDVAVDLRPQSPTFRRWHAVRLKAGDGRMFYVPEGCGHGLQSLTDDSEVQYMTSAAYAPQHAVGVRFDDPAFGIEWPLPATLLSDADSNWPPFAAANQPIACGVGT